MWSQLDANMHLRHSAYADFAAQARLELLEKLGCGMKEFAKHKIGPVLFREELIYLKEVGPGDTIRITCELSKLSQDHSRWSFVQHMHKGDGTKVATINVDGAWIDTEKRKLAALPPELLKVFQSIPKIEG
ncbi:MAG TPA: thioesterase [Bacteroidetes bacterium]|jgi:acyl-CoA thioester hydrolase|nr:thioesterase [Bacteroidota bacterium]